MRITRGSVFAVVSVLLAGLAIWQFLATSLLQVRIALADDQLRIFAEMVQRSRSALGKSPPDLNSAYESLRYVLGYYESGSKQITGSVLDRIVERERQDAAGQIISELRRVSPADYGTDPAVWLKAIDDNHSHSDAGSGKHKQDAHPNNTENMPEASSKGDSP